MTAMWGLFDLFCLLCMLYVLGKVLELIGNLWLIGSDVSMRRRR